MNINNKPVNSKSLQDSDAYSLKKKPTRTIEGFDFLRAIFSIAIVALKTNFFLLVELLVSGTLAYALMAKIAYLAVPIFLQMSLFLFYLKSEKSGLSYFLKKRLPRLMSLYFFWVGLKVLFDISKGDFARIKNITSSAKSLIEFIVSGGQSPFFFLFQLIFLSSLAAILVTGFRRLEKKSIKLFIGYSLLFSSCLLIFSLSVTELVVSQLGGNPETGLVRSISSIAFWDYNPLCFLPYLFTTLIAIQELNEGKLKRWSSFLKLKVFGLLSFFVFFTILEWYLFEKLLHYSRLSLVFGSWLFLYLALLSSRKAPPIIKFLSSCSLGIYGFHVFLTDVLLPTIGNNSFLRNLFQTVPGLEILIGFVVVLAGSIALTLSFKRIRGVKNYVV